MTNLLVANGNDFAEAIPQALIAATVAAKNAETMAWQSLVLDVAILGAIMILGAMVLYMAFQFRELVTHVNGMRMELVSATRKLALSEGNVAGRAELAEEQADLKKEKS